MVLLDRDRCHEREERAQIISCGRKIGYSGQTNETIDASGTEGQKDHEIEGDLKLLKEYAGPSKH